MHKIGLKLWSTNKNYFDEAKKLFEQGFYDYIELYAVPESLELIDFWKKLKIPYIIHGPHYGNGLNFADSQKVSENINLAKQTIRYADELHAEYIIFHPGTGGHIQETVRQLGQIGDSRILIENKPYLGFDRLFCLGSKPEEIEYVMKECGVGCCLDIGHAICAANSHKVDHEVFIKRFAALRPSVYHISDGDLDSEVDRHEHLGHGNYDFEKVTKYIDANRPLILETEKKSKHNLNDFVEDVLFIRKIFFLSSSNSSLS